MRTSGHWRVGVSAGLLALCGVALAQTSLPCANPQQAVPDAYFGLHMHRFHDRRLVARDGGFKTWRLWDAGVAWPNLQPERGRWDTRRLDFALSIAQGLGVRAGLVLGLTPQWAAARPQLHGFMGAGTSSELTNLDDWDAYVRGVAERYKGRLEFYEVWNEPNSGGYFGGTPGQMVELARHVWRIVKQVDPGAVVLTPSVASREGLPWLRRYAEAGGLQYADALSYHFYTDPNRPEDLIALVKDVESIVQQYRPGLPLWNTESGVPPRAAAAAGGPTVPSDAHLLRSMALGWCLGVQRFYYYGWDNGRLGLIDPDSAEPTSTYAGWQAAGRWLRGATLGRCELRAGLWRCTLNEAGGTPSSQPAQLVWADQAAVPLPAGDWQVENMNGQRGESGAGARVDARPLLLRPVPRH